MRFIADLHIHSHFSMATSKKLNPEHLDYRARLKGIKVVATGDFTHPKWLEELKEKLEPAEPGLFRLKPQYRIAGDLPGKIPGADEPRFILSAEISNIYKKTGQVRKIHNVILAPDFETVANYQHELQKRKFNISSDGRPILGMDARDLLELTLEVNPFNFFIPAHIWTPWFSALGAKSGFNSIEEAFEDLTPHIFAVETGLSSDPPMNWMVQSLDRFTLVSNSDAHSPEKLGRNANYFDCELSYQGICEAMKNPGDDTFKGTIDMYPQEGKYHYAGHRKCGVQWNPLEAVKNGYVCPVCGKKVTMGVMNRVIELSDREDIETRPERKPFHSIIPLKEILSEILQVGENTARVSKEYDRLLRKYGPEMSILLETPLEKLRQNNDVILAEGIQRMRERKIFVNEGYDGEYGTMKVFSGNEIDELKNRQQAFLFENTERELSKPEPRPLIPFDLEELQAIRKSANYKTPETTATMAAEENPGDILSGLNPQQKAAAMHSQGPALVIAGPGTGKTRVLTSRIEYLVTKKEINPENILALTFANKAAEEIRERMEGKLNQPVKAYTFHSFGLEQLQALKGKEIQLIDEEDKISILRQKGNLPASEAKKLASSISKLKQLIIEKEEIDKNEVVEKYWHFLKNNALYDIDDLLYELYFLLEKNSDYRNQLSKQFHYILVDEYQDINPVQYKLIQLLTDNRSPNLFAIGDPNQAIYGFRGADVKFIQRFRDDFPEAKYYRLPQSYRCSEPILKASADVLLTSDTSWTPPEGNDSNIKLKIVRNYSDSSEAEYIARTVEEMIGGLRFFSMDSNISAGNENYEVQSLDDFAILCRSRQQFPAIAKALEDHSIPHELIGDSPITQNKEVRKILQILKKVFNPEVYSRLAEKSLDITTEGILKEMKVSGIIKYLCDKGYSSLKDDEPLLYSRLLHMAKDYDSDTGAFIKALNLRSGADMTFKNAERVRVMTLHASKGQEFNAVFIAGCEEGLIPYTLFRKNGVDYAEEQRLLFVGMTRAKQYLFLTHADRRKFHNMDYRLKRSSFIDKIKKSYYDKEQQEVKEKAGRSQLDLFG
ncbi:MAG: UvrD-helicase domain-containing protein [Bacteroidales bacterium]|nr:UvrD-helicase domain-containing protein [Bacteroidales bacterium]MCF8332983.1 UvrD-helicase domain-containing protein [Bacteroidales bacterium]